MAKMFFKMNFTPAERSAAPWKADEWRKNRAFYDLSADYNYFRYSLNGEKAAKNKDYLDYMEKSTGAFNLKGEYTKEELDGIKKQLKDSKSIIWHGFISFDQELSKNFNTIEDCIEYLRPTWNTLIENSHLKKENITPIFSLHTDTNNRHIHFEFFENEPTRLNKNGETEYTKKGAVRQSAIDNFMVSSGLWFDSEKHELAKARDAAVERLKEICPAARTGEKTYADAIGVKLLELAEKLPEEGRTAYSSGNMRKLRKEVDRVANYIVTQDRELAEKVKKYYAEVAKREVKVREIMREQQFAYIKGGVRLDKEDLKAIFDGMNPEISKDRLEEWNEPEKITAISRLQDDMKGRIGNYVINLAKFVKKNRTSEQSGLQKRKTSGSDKSKKIAAKTARNRTSRKLAYLLKRMRRDNFRAKTDFTYELHAAEYEIRKEQYEAGAKD